jgi:hypothetical protein
MNCGCIESSVGLDRLATQDEVRSAMSLSSPSALEFLRDDFSAVDPDSNVRASNLREEREWLMIVGQMRDCICN